MNWLEKVEYLIEREKDKKPGDSFFYDVYFKENCWEPGEIDGFVKDYPWLPKTYCDFIAKFDSIGIAFVRFYGSKKRDAIPLHEILEESKPFLKDNYFPFGRDADGSNFIFNKKGQVFLWDEWDYEFEDEPKWLADSLEEFVGDCILGKRYHEFDSIENNNYFNFLKSMSWA